MSKVFINPDFVQHGDVVIQKIAAIPADAKPRKEATVLMDGEFTGHAHRATGGDVCVLETGSGERFLSAPTGTTVAHEEHRRMSVFAGLATIRPVNHWDPTSQMVMPVRD